MRTELSALVSWVSRSRNVSALTRDLRLNAVADYVSFSPNYLHTLFLRETGITLRAYVEEVRIQKSIELLMESTMTLTEIAYACGFNDLSYFIKTFKAEKGITPRAFRRRG